MVFNLNNSLQIVSWPNLLKYPHKKMNGIGSLFNIIGAEVKW